MVAVLIALAVSYAMTRHIAIMPVVTAVIVLVFGGLTLVLHDDLFIKLKPTIIYVLFGGTLLGGVALGKPLLGIAVRPDVPADGRRLAQAHLALGAVLLLLWRCSTRSSGARRPPISGSASNYSAWCR